MRRRTFVALVGSTSVTTLAGCAEESSEPDSQATVEDNNDDGGGNQDQSGGSSPEEPDTPTETPTETPEQSSEPEREAIGYPSEYIEVRDVQYNQPENQYSGPVIDGVVDNVSGEELSYVEVQVQAFNSNDEQIGEGLDNTTDLRPDKSWRFECEFWDVDEENIAYWMGRAEVSTY